MPEKRRRILVVHCRDSVECRLKTELMQLGFDVTSVHKLKEVLPAVSRVRPAFVIAELRLSDGPTLQVLRQIVEEEKTAVVVVTAHDSIATATECERLGVTGYWVKPVTAKEILSSMFDEPAQADLDVPHCPMRLERAMWEFINLTLVTSGSVSQAARVLGIDRRSLRRMLGRYSPKL